MKTLLACALLTACFTTQAAYPEKPIRLVIPFPAGGGADSMARPLAAARLSAELKTAMADPELRQQMVAVGVDPVYSTPAEFAEIIRKDIVKWAAVVKATGARID